jgi:hypothetical protein
MLKCILFHESIAMAEGVFVISEELSILNKLKNLINILYSPKHSFAIV